MPVGKALAKLQICQNLAWAFVAQKLVLSIKISIIAKLYIALSYHLPSSHYGQQGPWFNNAMNWSKNKLK